MMKKQVDFRDKNEGAKRYQGGYPKNNDSLTFMHVLKIPVGGVGDDCRATGFSPV